jgi:hypothetical protein
MGRKEHLTALFNARNSTELVNELGNFQLVMVSKRGTSASNHLVLRLRDDVDTDAAPSPLVEEPEGEPANLSLNSHAAGLFFFPSVFEEYFCYNAILAGVKRRELKELFQSEDSNLVLARVLQHVLQQPVGLTMSQRNMLSTLAQETPKKGNLRMSSACPGAGKTFLLMRIAKSFLEMSGAEDQQHSCACPMSVTWCC